MISIKTDTTNIRSTLRTLQRSAPLATQDSVIVTASAVLRKTGTRSAMRFHKGTARMARGWIKAANGLAIGNAHLAEFGVRPMLVPNLTVSTMVSGAYKSLEYRANRSAKRLRELRAIRAEIATSSGFAGNKRGEASRRASLGRLDREINRISEFQVRADNALQEFRVNLKRPGVLVMFGRRTKGDFRLTNIERIYPHEFGATTRVLRTADRASVQIEHLEPHAAIVEGRTRIFAAALSDVRYETGGLVSTGTGREADAFFKRIGTGLAPGTRVVRGSGGRLFVRK